MKLRKSHLVSMAMALVSFHAMPWGQKGHDTVCFIAENHLTDNTKRAVENLLDGKSIVYFSNWLDNASNTPEYKYSKTWHYKNVDAGETFENAPLLDKGDVVRAIREQSALLVSDNATDDQKSLALKMLVHLVGDVHQPMHLGHRDDLGGNRWNVKFFNSPTNLHSVWDSKIVESGHKWSYTEWQQQIDRVSDERRQEIIKEGSPEKWGKETYLLASKIYNSTPKEQNLSYDYVAAWTPVVEEQLLAGGLRLADLLNSIFDEDYKGANLIIKK